MKDFFSLSLNTTIQIKQCQPFFLLRLLPLIMLTVVCHSNIYADEGRIDGDISTASETVSIQSTSVDLNRQINDAEDLLAFTDSDQRNRYYSLIAELRCPKCQNQNLADSDAPIAKDLRQEIFNLLQEGLKDQQILEFMEARYGEFVLYSPPINTATVTLWFAPLLLALITSLTLMVRIKRRQAEVEANDNDKTGSIDELKKQRLRTLLDDDSVRVGNE